MVVGVEVPVGVVVVDEVVAVAIVVVVMVVVVEGGFSDREEELGSLLVSLLVIWTGWGARSMLDPEPVTRCCWQPSAGVVSNRCAARRFRILSLALRVSFSFLAAS